MISERGSAVVESVAGIVALLVLVVGVIEVAFALYARNVVVAAAHEGARAAIELGSGPGDASAVARAAVHRAAGGLVDDLVVETSFAATRPTVRVRVTVSGVLDAFGPVPFPMRLSSTASVTRATRVR